MRLIDADARVTVQSFDVEHEEYNYTEMSVAEALDFATDEGCPPAVDAAPVVHGRWVDADTRTGHHLLTQCSECSFGFYGDVSYWAYCPVCGSKMDGDSDA